jgi:benzoyl-CoA reductase/2-hydroxyglutaryl-CoA dehydratase subunit BcrC/BadD/HgdB
MCPLIKSSYGLAITDTCPFFHVADALVGETTCDGKKKVFELLADLKPVHVLQLPTGGNPSDALKSWQREILQLADFLKTVTGKTIDTESLAGEIHVSNEIRALQQRAVAIFQKQTPPLRWSEMLKVLAACDFLVERFEYVQKLREFVSAAEASYDSAPERPTEPARLPPRILITGTPMSPVTDKVMRITEESGGLVVCHDACSGVKRCERLVDEHSDPFEALARFTLDIPCACMSPNPGRLRLLADSVAKYEVRGVIDTVWQGCHTFNVESELVRRACAELGLRYLKLETDYSENDTGQLQTRVEAFVESLS